MQLWILLSLFNLKHFGSLLFTIFIGMIFGLEGFIKNLQRSGKWHIDTNRLLIIGLPSLFLSIEYFRFLLLNNVLNLGVFYLIAPASEPFFRFVVGYALISSIYKI